MQTTTSRFMDQLVAYYKTIIHRDDVHARQCSDGRWVLARQPFTEDLLRSHVMGERTIGAYILKPGNTVSTVIIDIDNQSARTLSEQRDNALELIGQIRKSAEQRGCGNIVFNASGRRGWHGTVLFDSSVPADQARRLGHAIVEGAGIDKSMVWRGLGCEVYPKQDRLKPEGLGNLVSLPEGKHKLGGRSGFVDPSTLEMIPRDDLCDWLATGVKANQVHDIDFPAPRISRASSTRTTHAADLAKTEVRLGDRDDLIRQFDRGLQLLQLDAGIRRLFFGDAMALQRYHSRSEAEFALFVRMGRSGVDPEIAAHFVANASIGKWNEAGESYKEHTLAAVQRVLCDEKVRG